MLQQPCGSLAGSARSNNYSLHPKAQLAKPGNMECGNILFFANQTEAQEGPRQMGKMSRMPYPRIREVVVPQIS